MALTDTYVKNVKPSGKPAGDKHTDGGGLYLLVASTGGRYWRMDYRFANKRKTLSLGVYPPRPGAGADPQDKDGQTLLFWYPAVTAAAGDYIRAAVKIEAGAKSALDPHIAATVRPYVILGQGHHPPWAASVVRPAQGTAPRGPARFQATTTTSID